MQSKYDKPLGDLSDSVTNFLNAVSLCWIEIGSHDSGNMGHVAS